RVRADRDIETHGQAAPEHDTVTSHVKILEREIAAPRGMPDGRDRLETRLRRDDAHDKNALGVIVTSVDARLRMDEGRRGDYAVDLLHSSQRGIPARHGEILAVGEHAYVRAADEDFFAKVLLQPIHHADDQNERAHTDD